MRRMATILTYLLLATASFAGDAWAQGSSITLLGYHTTVPAAWISRTPSSSSHLAQFVVPGPDSASNAEVVVYFFGNTPGGNVEANLARWRGQFSTPDGSPVPETVTQDSSGAFPIAIAETPHGALFIQLFGPAARVASERETFLRFVKGLKVN